MRSHSCVFAVLLVVLCCEVRGFTIRRRSEPREDLTEAFRLLERQRRRIREDEYLDASRIPGPRSTIPELSGWGQGPPRREEEQWIGDGFDMNPFEEQSYPPEEFRYEEEKPTKTVTPSAEEIEDIFSNSDSGSAVSAPAEVTQTEPDTQEEKRNSETSDSADKDDNLTEDEFKALMSAVEKLQKRALAKKENKKSIDTLSTPEPEPVSKEELTEVFEENDDGDATAPEPSIEEVSKEDVVPLQSSEVELLETPDIDAEEAQAEDLAKYKDTLSSIEKYWRLNDYFNPEDRRRKRFTKRAPQAAPPNSVPLEETYLHEIQRLRTQIQQLKLMSQLEDMENDALTQTLNEATLSQMEGTVSVKEFGSLEKAIKLEEAIQDLKNGNINPFIVELVASNALGGEEEDGEKRGEPLYKKERKRMDAADLEESYPMFDTKRSETRPLEGDYIIMPEDKRSSKRVQEHDVDRWYDRPAREDNSAARQQYLAAQDAINDMVGLLASSDMPSDTEVEQEEMEEDMPNDVMVQLPESTGKDSSSDQCPSDPIITDCAFADLQGLPIDDEARDLCNRHELCYQCGSTVGAKQGDCDNLYRGDAAILCSKDPNCVLEAELFLQQMKLKHRYNIQYEDMCDNSCTADFIGL